MRSTSMARLAKCRSVSCPPVVAADEPNNWSSDLGELLMLDVEGVAAVQRYITVDAGHLQSGLCLDRRGT